MKTKKIIMVSIMIIFCAFFSGCLNKYASIDKTLIIQAIGVDFNESDNKFEVTLQCFDLLKASGSDNEKSESKGSTKVLSAKGDSIKQAIESTMEITGIIPIYSQTRIIIIGEDLLKEGIDSAMDLFTRDYKMRANMPVAVAKDIKASDLIKADEGNAAIPAETIEKILESGKVNSVSASITIADIVRLKNEKTSSIIIPALTLIKEGEGEEETKYAKLDGLAVFAHNKLYKYLSLEEIRAYNWVINDFNKSTFIIEESEVGIVTFDIIRSKTKTETIITENGRLKYNINIECSIDVTEIDSKKEYMFEEKEIEILQNKCADKIKGDVEKVIEKCLVDYNCDIFRFGQRLLQKSPQNYRKLSEKWNDVLPDVLTSVNVKVTIRRTGKFLSVK